jgi:hypothetical protein
VLWVGGTANKNKDRFEQKFNELAAEIRAELKRTQPQYASKQESDLSFVAR